MTTKHISTSLQIAESRLGCDRAVTYSRCYLTRGVLAYITHSIKARYRGAHQLIRWYITGLIQRYKIAEGIAVGDKTDSHEDA